MHGAQEVQDRCINPRLLLARSLHRSVFGLSQLPYYPSPGVSRLGQHLHAPDQTPGRAREPLHHTYVRIYYYMSVSRRKRTRRICILSREACWHSAFSSSLLRPQSHVVFPTPYISRREFKFPRPDSWRRGLYPGKTASDVVIVHSPSPSRANTSPQPRGA